jgi:hypothetical protein
MAEEPARVASTVILAPAGGTTLTLRTDNNAHNHIGKIDFLRDIVIDSFLSL